MNSSLQLSRTKLKAQQIHTNGRFGHVHHDYEIYYLLSGEVQYFVKSSAFVLKAGDLVFIPKNIIHKTVYSINKNYERLLLNFTEDDLYSEDRHLLSDLTPLHITFSSDNKQKIQDLFLKLEAEFNNNNPHKEILLKTMLTELLVYINRYQVSFKSNRQVINHSTKIINQCAKYISENCQNDINLSNMSKIAAMSESYFSREFKKNTGFGFNEYLVMNRLLSAQKLLCTTKLPITEVATNCGFNDSNYFAAVFKKQYGITPYKYRRLNSR